MRNENERSLPVTKQACGGRELPSPYPVVIKGLAVRAGWDPNRGSQPHHYSAFLTLFYAARYRLQPWRRRTLSSSKKSDDDGGFKAQGRGTWVREEDSVSWHRLFLVVVVGGSTGRRCASHLRTCKYSRRWAMPLPFRPRFTSAGART